MAKIDINIEKLELAASKLRAMSHPMRIAIIDLLAGGNKYPMETGLCGTIKYLRKD